MPSSAKLGQANTNAPTHRVQSVDHPKLLAVTSTDSSSIIRLAHQNHFERVLEGRWWLANPEALIHQWVSLLWPLGGSEYEVNGRLSSWWYERSSTLRLVI